ncbi:hypothetical protein CEXT_547051 [Caerostris extrusa]|uniref:Uncharacterized protein n=1 Tax=Caerostris extrusa TaxID=172846 RepID=A0AAV4PQG7_CAEEX|nr:hypothetical protein CEXT_547051 [Caerostris extrusa]
MEILPFHMDHVPEFFIRKCELELKESPENKVKSIEELRTMLKNADITSSGSSKLANHFILKLKTELLQSK